MFQFGYSYSCETVDIAELLKSSYSAGDNGGTGELCYRHPTQSQASY